MEGHGAKKIIYNIILLWRNKVTLVRLMKCMHAQHGLLPDHHPELPLPAAGKQKRLRRPLPAAHHSVAHRFATFAASLPKLSCFTQAIGL